MNNDTENPESSSGRFLKTVQPLRDLESNWTVDLAKNLEEYLLKICTGEISRTDDAPIPVNFAEAALLLQGSVQVYSRKVEYLYSLVLHALEFVSQKSQDDQATSTSAQPESGGVHKAKEQEDDQFWGLDDVAMEAKTLLDNTPPSYFLRPPANLVVLEGECLDAGCDAGELESYLLATNGLYRDFILLDPCDAVAVDNFLDCKAGKGNSNVYRGSSLTSKGHKSFQLPSRRSGGTGNKSVGKKQGANLTQSPCVDHGFDPNDGFSPPGHDVPEGNCNNFEMGGMYSGPGDSDYSDEEEDDPWKPLNPHEPGNLRVKPYRKVKSTRRLGVGAKKHASLITEFPLAKPHGPISKELVELWEARFDATEKQWDWQSLQLYEKLRRSLISGESKTCDTYCNAKDNTEDGYDSGDPDLGPQDFDMPDNNYYNEDLPSHQAKHDDGGVNQSGVNDAFDDPDTHANLEDLCRSHLDSLLANLAETEKQTELATRVSTWKQRIEQNLDEQNSRPSFDIHKYGERVLDKLSTKGDGVKPLAFGDVVRGQEKHDIARTFSALLQLVNNGDVDLIRNSSNGTSTCHSDVNPFYVKPLKNERKKGILLQSSGKRRKSPIMKRNGNIKSLNRKENSPVVYSSPPGSFSGCRLSAKLRKASGVRCNTPEGKKRRKSRLIAPLDLHFAG